METVKVWFEDILQQFHDKKNIEVLINAFAKQMDELYKVYEDMMYATTLQNATGQNLKYIGDIVSTSQKEAQEILKNSGKTELTDDIYRKVLMYKTLANNCDCTYENIIESISLLWDASKVKYVETAAKPATIYLNLEDANIDGLDPAVGRVLAIRPAGVAMIYAIGYLANINMSGIDKAKMPGLIVTTSAKEKDEAVMEKMEMTLHSRIEEDVTASMLSTRGNWYLDGTYMLDGTKLLNSGETIEEVL